jgi:hypothetical protein
MVGIVTSGPASAGPLPSDELTVLNRQIVRFCSLSADDKSALIESARLLSEKGFPIQTISKLLSSLKSEEGVIAKKVISRFQNSITPTQLKLTGVFHPLMSGYPSGKGQLTIYLPEHLESYADHGFILELLRYKSTVDSVNIERVSGEIKIQNEERLSQLFMGYVSELLSDQKIARIQFSRSSYYQLGRMLARAKLVQLVLADCSIPSKFVQVPTRFLGGTKEFQDPETIRTLRSIISGDVELIDDLLKNLAGHVYKVQPDKVRSKIDASLFTPYPEFVHMHERRAHVKSKKGKGGKNITTFNTIKATKPSSLTTIALWEKDACEELWDRPWQAQHDLETEYNNTPPLERNYVELSKKLSKIINEQWTNKQILLRKTNHRLVYTGLNDQVPLYERLNTMRARLSEIKSIETCDRETLKRIISAADILPSGLCTLPDKFATSWMTALKTRQLEDTYPKTTELILKYLNNVGSDVQPITAE